MNPWIPLAPGRIRGTSSIVVSEDARETVRGRSRSHLLKLMLPATVKAAARTVSTTSGRTPMLDRGIW
jgi:hypothetical protein